MNRERQRELDESGEKLTPEEMREGWHYCPDFDELLTQGEIFSDEEEMTCICGFDRRAV